MNIKDEYIVYIERMGSKFYYKNGKLHREDGPAYVPWKLHKESIELENQELYIRKYVGFVDEPLYDMEVSPDDKTTGKMKYRPSEPNYYLEGIQYKKEEFDAIILDKQLPKNGEHKIKSKI